MSKIYEKMMFEVIDKVKHFALDDEWFMGYLHGLERGGVLTNREVEHIKKYALNKYFTRLHPNKRLFKVTKDVKEFKRLHKYLIITRQNFMVEQKGIYKAIYID